MQRMPFGWAALLASALLIPAGCSGAAASHSKNSSASTMEIVEVSHGFGLLLPYQAFALGAGGNPTTELVPLRTIADMQANLTLTNPVQPTTQWPTSTVLPNGDSGNHYIYAEFNSDLDRDTFLDGAPGAASNSQLSGTVTIQATDPITQQTTSVRGRVFVGGFTYGGTASGSPLQLEWQQWVDLDSNGKPIALTVDGQQPGLGFPGTESTGTFPDASKLLSPKSLVFVRDEDGDLSTPEAFPAGQQISLNLTSGIGSLGGKSLVQPGVAATTVGPDSTSPEVGQSPPPFSVPSITPGNGEQGVDPAQNIIVEFTEPIQPYTVAPLPSTTPPTLGSAIQVQFGPSSATVNVPFSITPLSPFDLTRFEVIPSFGFPGAGPTAAACTTFNRIDITVNSGQFDDLAGNTNQTGLNTFYATGFGPGLVNAPVAPDAIYVARFGAQVAISVVDLNGNGASTGTPAYNAAMPMTEGNSQYPNNPNVAIQGGALTPPLSPGDCTFNGGSAGVFTLTTNSNLETRLATSPLFESVGDFMLGHALDSSFNNGPPPFGCQAGGGNLCASSGLKTPTPVQTALNTLGPAQPGQFSTAPVGAENLVCWAPHPNPPPLTFPPLCVSPFIGGQEPTSVDSTTAGLQNLLTPGAFPQGDPESQTPPQGLLTSEQNAFFQGPGSPQTLVQNCAPYQIRQQVGNFLYVLDRIRREIVVLNSNRFNVVDRIPVSDPTSMAMSPDLVYIAVTNQGTNTVSFIDIDPSSATFHQVVKTTQVGIGPSGIAWEPDNEDILCCNELEGSMSVISATSLEVRKTVANQVNAPFEVAITPRQMNFGFNRQVYFAYVMDRNGKVSIFESGPDGPGGWGMDDIVGQPAFTFPNPKAIQPDHIALISGVWIVHERALNLSGAVEGPVGTGAVTNLLFETTTAGPLPLAQQGIGGALSSREIQFRIALSLGESELTGIPMDLAFDNQRNLGGLANPSMSLYSAGSPALINGKNLVRGAGGGVQNTNEPALMFLSVPNSSQGGGVVDVIDLNTNKRRDVNLYQAGVQSVPADGATLVMDFFRQ